MYRHTLGSESQGGLAAAAGSIPISAIIVQPPKQVHTQPELGTRLLLDVEVNKYGRM